MADRAAQTRSRCAGLKNACFKDALANRCSSSVRASEARRAKRISIGQEWDVEPTPDKITGCRPTFKRG
jgi:hypothetical protein